MTTAAEEYKFSDTLYISELIDLALAALRNRDFAEAQKACHRILTDRPDQPAAWHLLGVSALEVGDSAAAIRALRRAVALRRARPEYHLTLGRAYREAGRFEEALETLRQARELAPDSPEILIQLAAVQMALGRVDEAKETSLLGSHLLLRKKAMRLRLRLAMLRVPVAALLRSLSTPRCSYAVAAALERSRILARYDELSAATASCRQAVDMAPDYAPACTALGRLMLQAGDVEGALTYLKKASDRAPEDAPTLMEYAQALLTSSRWDETLAVLDRMPTRDADSAPALCLKARTLVDKGQAPAAVPMFQKALRLDPRNPEATCGLAGCFLDMGRFEDGRSWLAKTLEIDPAFARAYHLSAHSGLFDADDPVFTRIQTILADYRTPARDRRYLHFAAATVLERAGDADGAFTHYRRGNDLHDVVFCPDTHTAVIEHLMQVYDEDFFGRTAGWGDASELPVFVLGMPRSGTTLVEQILASHPDVFGAGELESFNHIVCGLGETLNTDEAYPECARRLDRETVRALAAGYLAELRSLSQSATRIIDKMPNNYLHIGLIATLFPNARIIHCRRDPLDTCLSIYCHDFPGNHPYAYDLANLGHYYRQYDRVTDHWRRVLPQPMLEVQYEDLVADQEGMTRKILNFCGLEWDDRCLAFYKTERVIHTASRSQVRRPIYKSSVGRWKRYERHLGPLKAALAAD